MIDRSFDESGKDESRGRKVWKAREEIVSQLEIQDDFRKSMLQPSPWNMAVDDDDRSAVHESLARICEQVRLLFSPIFSMFVMPIRPEHELNYFHLSILAGERRR